MFLEGGNFLPVNGKAHFESDTMHSKGDSKFSEGDLVPYEVVILTGGVNIFLECGIMPLEDVRAAYFKSTVFVLEAVSSICCEARYF